MKTISFSDGEVLAEYLGSNIIVRTVTMHYTGHLTSYDERFLVLDEAAWIASSGRWGNALASGVLDEVEPYPGRCLVSIGAVVDISAWDHSLPRGAQ